MTNNTTTTNISDINFYLLNNKRLLVSGERISKYQEQYPELNVKNELTNCSRKYNSGSLRDADGAKRYINNWLEVAERERLTAKQKSFSAMQNRNEPLSEEWWRELARKPGNLIAHVKI